MSFSQLTLKHFQILNCNSRMYRNSSQTLFRRLLSAEMYHSENPTTTCKTYINWIYYAPSKEFSGHAVPTLGIKFKIICV